MIGLYCKKIERGHTCPSGLMSPHNERGQECPPGQMKAISRITNHLNVI